MQGACARSCWGSASTRPVSRSPSSPLSTLPPQPNLTQPCLPPPYDFPARQVADEDLQRGAEAAGARVQTTVNALEPSVLGSCARFEERQVGAERFNIFTGARSRLLL